MTQRQRAEVEAAAMNDLLLMDETLKKLAPEAKEEIKAILMKKAEAQVLAAEAYIKVRAESEAKAAADRALAQLKAERRKAESRVEEKFQAAVAGAIASLRVKLEEALTKLAVATKEREEYKARAEAAEKALAALNDDLQAKAHQPEGVVDSGAKASSSKDAPPADAASSPASKHDEFTINGKPAEAKELYAFYLGLMGGPEGVRNKEMQKRSRRLIKLVKDRNPLEVP